MLTVWHLTRTAAIGWWNDRAMSLGASIAYYTVFSLAPMLLAVIAVAGLVFGREAAQAALVEEISALAGPNAAEAIRSMLASASDFGSGVIGTVVGVVTFLVLATGALFELQDDLNIIFRVERAAPSGVLAFLHTRLFSLALIVAIGFLLLVSLVIDAALTAAGQYVAGAWPLLLRAVNHVVSLAATTALFALMFKLLPAANLAWREVGVGAFVTAILFTLGKLAIGYYLGKSDLASTYGAAASIITILLWIYYSSQILLFGAEFTRAYAERRGARRAPTAKPGH
jgi:membrane protein